MAVKVLSSDGKKPAKTIVDYINRYSSFFDEYEVNSDGHWIYLKNKYRWKENDAVTSRRDTVKESLKDINIKNIRLADKDDHGYQPNPKARKISSAPQKILKHDLRRFGLTPGAKGKWAVPYGDGVKVFKTIKEAEEFQARQKVKKNPQDRITKEKLKIMIDALNRVTGETEHKAGGYSLDYAYGGVRVVRKSQGGGEVDISKRGTNREIYEFIHAFIDGCAACSRKKNPLPKTKSSAAALNKRVKAAKKKAVTKKRKATTRTKTKNKKIRKSQERVWVIAMKSPEGKEHFLKVTGKSFTLKLRDAMLFRTSNLATGYYHRHVNIPKKYANWDKYVKDYAIGSVDAGK